MGAREPSLLDVRGLALAVPGSARALLREIAFDVAAGAFVAILGANGCGKTTLLRSILGLVPATHGTVSVAGRIALISQRAHLVKRRSVRANVAMGALGFHRGWRTALGALPATELVLAQGYLRAVGLEHLADRRADALSGGEAQRTAIARALAQRPQILLADEPVANLDPEAAEEVLSLLRRLAHEDGLAVLCVLHQPELARRFADRIIGLRDGGIAFDRPTQEVSPAAIDALYRFERTA